MSHPAGWVLPTLLLATTVSCTTLRPTGNPGEEGKLAVDSLTVPNAVPLAWGRLVAVTYDPEETNASFLWFEDEAGVVRRIGYDNGAAELWPVALTIGRR